MADSLSKFSKTVDREKPGVNKNYMSIGVSVRTTKFAARNSLGGVRQESNPQSPTAYSSVR